MSTSKLQHYGLIFILCILVISFFLNVLLWEKKPFMKIFDYFYDIKNLTKKIQLSFLYTLALNAHRARPQALLCKPCYLWYEMTASGGTRTNCQVHALCTWASEDSTWAKFCPAEIEPLFSYVLIFFSLKKKRFPFLGIYVNFSYCKYCQLIQKHMIRLCWPNTCQFLTFHVNKD